MQRAWTRSNAWGVVALELQLDLRSAHAYRSNAQIARVVTEQWFAAEMYCPACNSDRLGRTANNCPGYDFACPECKLRLQLKSRKFSAGNRIVDAGYGAMIKAIRSDTAPSLALLQYSSSWSVTDLLVVPSFFFTEAAIEKRKPLSAFARRANWVGCNILLDKIPIDGRITVVKDGFPVSPPSVRNQYKNVLPLKELDSKARGWTLDVLRCLRSLGKQDVTLAEAYAFAGALQREHPNNKHVKDKIRQQLQVLRNLGILQFEERGRYRLVR